MLGSLVAEVEIIAVNTVICLSPCLQTGNFSIGLDLGRISIKGPSLSFADVVQQLQNDDWNTDDYDFYLCFVHEQYYSHTTGSLALTPLTVAAPL